MASKRPETTFTFKDPDTDELVYECGARQGALNRAKLYLFKGAEAKNETQVNVFLALWGFLSAEAAGNPVVKLPANKRDIDMECVLDLMDTVSTFYEVNSEDTEQVLEEGSENPTGTSRERS